MRCCTLLLVAAGMLGCSEGHDHLCVPAQPYPAPRFANLDGMSAAPRSVCVDAADLMLDAPSQSELDTATRALLARVGLQPGNGGDCQWRIRLTGDTPTPDCARLADWTTVIADESWCGQTVVVDARDAASTLRVQSARGALDALTVLLASGGLAREGTLADAPAFALRGVVEGTYGGPWSDSERVTTLAMLASLRANTYLYAPKGDPFTNAQWASPYPDSALRAIRDAAAAARAGLIHFYWAVSPGWRYGGAPQAESIHYGGDTDFQRLTAKIDQLHTAGVDGFALLLDDIETAFAWNDDAMRFGSLAEAHAFLANRIEQYVASTTGTHIIFVGTHYSSDPDWEDYNDTLGSLLAPTITVLWTGNSVYSRTISAMDLADIDHALGRQVAIWDNEPSAVVPLSGRSSDLATASSGYLSNPTMTEFGRSPIEDYWAVMGTIADYAWDPTHYSPSDSLLTWEQMRTCAAAPGRPQPESGSAAVPKRATR